MRAHPVAALALLAAGCTDPPTAPDVPRDAGAEATTADAAADIGDDRPLQPPLPSHRPGGSARFLSADECVPCHAASAGPSLRDAAGRDVSPVRLWDRSMMALSGRDPYWLAAFSRERAQNPAAVDHVEQTCTRCHAPEGSVERAVAGGHLRFGDVTTDEGDVGHLAREGVGCTLCHQLVAEGLDDPARFGGHYLLGDRREIFGPHEQPLAAPMFNWVAFTPVYAPHTLRSALCASCHTVMTRALDAAGRAAAEDFPEQAPYLEWRDSDYNDEGTPGPRAATCQRCHMPGIDDDGRPIETVISTRNSARRTQYGRHEFLGGNAYMLRLMAANATWTGTYVEPSELTESATRTARNLTTAARLELTPPTVRDGTLGLTVRVANEAGHKFPTGYPTRRAWLHLRVLDAGGAVLFESGRVDAAGALVDGSGRRIDGEGVILPHRDRVTRDDEVQVWEAVPVDASGHVTHALLRAVRWARDDRILPRGWTPSHPDARWTTPVGVAGDADFVAGSDAVTYAIALGDRRAARVEVELRFQSVTPAAIEDLAPADTPASRRFVAMTRALPPSAVVVARAVVDVPP